MEYHGHDEHEHEAHSSSLKHELLHHMPYAIFSVAAALVLLSLVSHTGMGDSVTATQRADSLFHNFHFLHLLFATTGTVVTYLRFSRVLVRGLLVGVLSPVFFCTLSDAVLPYYGGRLLGVPMHWHVCFYSELENVLPFLLIGVLNGFIMARHHYTALARFSVGSHSIHIFVSSLASSLFLLAHGFHDWSASIGIVFLFLILAVLIPCTISDVVVPMVFAQAGKRQ